MPKISRRSFLGCGAVLGAIWPALLQRGTVRSAQRTDEPGLRPDALAVLTAIAAQVIPTGSTVGAAELGLGQDLLADAVRTPEARRLFEAGFRQVEETSQHRFGASFLRLETQQQRLVLQEIETSRFFRTVRDLTVRKFYESPVGARTLGFPGHGQPHGYLDYDLPPAADAAHSRSDGAALFELPSGEGRAEVQAVCAPCHDLRVVTAQRRTTKAWRQTVREMVEQYGARIEPDEGERIARYLGRHFGPR